mmetsp:Transcript_2566/g.7139  ORF Transcript_2566/g.7139 Transcript_2566/m.7139 type:complete len:101 (-) Transcript_2566:598-900(-)
MKLQLNSHLVRLAARCRNCCDLYCGGSWWPTPSESIRQTFIPPPLQLPIISQHHATIIVHLTSTIGRGGKIRSFCEDSGSSLMDGSNHSRRNTTGFFLEY